MEQSLFQTLRSTTLRFLLHTRSKTGTKTRIRQTPLSTWSTTRRALFASRIRTTTGPARAHANRPNAPGKRACTKFTAQFWPRSISDTQVRFWAIIIGGEIYITQEPIRTRSFENDSSISWCLFHIMNSDWLVLVTHFPRMSSHCACSRLDGPQGLKPVSPLPNSHSSARLAAPSGKLSLNSGGHQRSLGHGHQVNTNITYSICTT